jgi:hypothetical protein
VHVVCVNRAEKAILLVIRGTMSMHDVLIDLKGEYVDYTLNYKGRQIQGQVHYGMLLAAQNVIALVKGLIIELLEANPGYRPILLGHSLGAGTASTIALIWMEDEYIMGRGLRAYCYSVPSTMTPDFHEAVSDVVLSVIFGNDIVPKVSIGFLKDFAKMLLYFEQRDKKRAKIKAANIVKCMMYGYKGQEDTLVGIYKEIKSLFTSHKLEPPGYIYQIFDKSQHKEFKFIPNDTEEKMLGFFVPNSYHSEIIFTRSMVTDHTQIQLMKSMQKLITGHVEHSKTDMIRQAAATIIRSTLAMRGETDNSKIAREIQEALEAIQESDSDEEDNASVAPSMLDRRSFMRTTSIFTDDYRDEVISALDDLDIPDMLKGDLDESFTPMTEASQYEEEKFESS